MNTVKKAVLRTDNSGLLCSACKKPNQAKSVFVESWTCEGCGQPATGCGFVAGVVAVSA